MKLIHLGLSCGLYSLGQAILTLSLFSLFDGFVQAAPVTLAFDAIVGPPRQGVSGPLPPSWSTSLQQGEIISGRFTFEPFDAPADSVRTTFIAEFDFSLHIKAQSLTTEQYRIEVENNVLYVDDDDQQPNDSIRMGCALFGGPYVCTPRAVSPTNSTEWAFEIVLGGNSSVIEGADLPAYPAMWQGFSYYGLVVTFFDPTVNRYYGFSATPGSFQSVPEPNALFMLLCGMLALSSRGYFISARPFI